MKKRGLILITNNQWELMEEMFKLPVEEREAFLAKLVREGKADHIGSTTKSAPELAIEFIKHGIKAKSYVKGEKRERNNP